MIAARFLAAFLILLSGSTQASAQGLKIFLYGKSNSKTSETIENYLTNRVKKLLKDQYPCADTLTDDEARALLDWAKQRQLMGNPDEDALSNIAGALGAQHVVSVNVIQINSTITMNATGLDDRRGTVVSKQSATAHGEDEALDAADALAQKVVSDMIDSLPDCYVNEWVGTITYRRVYQGESRTTEDHLVVKGTKTTEITSKATTDADFEVRGARRPARALVRCAEERVVNIVTKATIQCPEPGRTVPWNATEVDRVTGRAEGKVDEAVASVSVDGGEFTISVTVPQIEGGTSSRNWSLDDSGGCGDPVTKHETQSISWTTFEEHGRVNGRIDPAKPDVLSGSQTIKVPAPAGIEETKIITWNLEFVRDPSARKN